MKTEKEPTAVERCTDCGQPVHRVVRPCLSGLCGVGVTFHMDRRCNCADPGDGEGAGSPPGTRPRQT